MRLARLRFFKRIVEWFSGKKTHKFQSQAFGINLFLELKAACPDLQIQTVFDVGAHHGESANAYARHFPDAKIYCFEPSSKNLAILASKVNSPRIRILPHAVGAQVYKTTLDINGPSDQYRLSALRRSTDPEPKKREEVYVTSIDNIAPVLLGKNPHINFLKIDTEGGDLDVLVGADGMLKTQKIDFVQVEAGMNRDNKRHCEFTPLRDFMESYDYRLFGIYEQTHEWPTAQQYLRRANLVFVSRRVIDTGK